MFDPSVMFPGLMNCFNFFIKISFPNNRETSEQVVFSNNKMFCLWKCFSQDPLKMHLKKLRVISCSKRYGVTCCAKF